MPNQRQPAAIHIDLDGAAEIYQVHGWPRNAGDDDPLFETGLRRALDFLSENKVRATLFVIACQLESPRKRCLLREAVRRGHEIASHTVTHRPLTSLNGEEKRREIVESRLRLTDGLGVAVHGFRAPAFRIDRASLEMIAEAGYAYDSSLFPGKRFARRVGVDSVDSHPHRPVKGRPLLELPMPSAAPLPFPFHPCFSLVLGMPYFHLGLRRFSWRAAPLVFLFHLTDFADPLPAHMLRGRKERFYTLSHLSAATKLARCRGMLDAVRKQFRIVPTCELIAPPPVKARSV